MAEDKNKDKVSKVDGTNANGDKALAQLVKKSINITTEANNREKTGYKKAIGAECLSDSDYTINVPVTDGNGNMINQYEKNNENTTVELEMTYHENGKEVKRPIAHSVDDRGRLILMPNATYVVGDAKYQTDEYGRVVTVVAKVGPKPKNERKPLPDTVPDRQTMTVTDENGNPKDTYVYDDKGHIIGYQLGGSDNPINLVAQYSGFNRGPYLGMENLARDVYDIENDENGDNPRDVYMVVQLTYPDGETTRPDGYFAAVEIGDEVLLSKRFINDSVDAQDNANTNAAIAYNNTLDKNSKEYQELKKRTQKEHDKSQDEILHEGDELKTFQAKIKRRNNKKKKQKKQKK